MIPGRNFALYRARLTVAFSVVALFATLPAAARRTRQPEFRLLPIRSSDPTRWETYALGVNLRRQVTGFTVVYSPESQRYDTTHAFIWSEGTGLTELPSPGVASTGLRVNNAGEVAGSVELDDGTEHAAVWRGGEMVDLGTLPGGTNSRANDINNRSEVTGWSEVASPAGTVEVHAFLWSAASMRDLGTLGGSGSGAAAINDCGDITGGSTTADGKQHGVLWTEGKIIDLGPDGTGPMLAMDVNVRQQVVGGEGPSSPGSNGKLWLWENGQSRALIPGDYSIYSATINAAGDIAGSWAGIDQPGGGFFIQGGKVYDLYPRLFHGPERKFNVGAAEDLNDAGDIVGWGFVPDHGRRGSPVGFLACKR